MPLGGNPNNPGAGDLLLTGDNGYFVQFQNAANQLGGLATSLLGTYNQIAPIWSSTPQNAAAIGNSGYTQNMPLSIAVPANNTTGSVPPQVEKKTDYLPWIIGGGIALVAILLITKG